MSNQKGDLYEKIQEAKERIGDDAINLIADYFHLENFSRNDHIVKASCPFGHIDKTPSFIWNGQEHYFHCFSCGKNYGILDLLIDKEKNTSKAIAKLFQMANMDYKFQIKEDNDDFFEGYCFPPEETNTDRAKVEEYCLKRGISKQTLDDMGIKQDKRGNVVFELRDLDNRLLSIKYRPSRKVKKGEAKMWWYQEKDAHGNTKRSVAPSLFNMNKIDFTKPLLITEGYFDALSCYEAGFKNVVSIYGGAEDDNWIQFNFDFLEQFQEIILWYDNDKAGKAGLDKVISRLGEYRCKIVSPTADHEDAVEDYYYLLGCTKSIRKTDANNILLACGKEAVLSLINNAQEIPSKRLKYLMDYNPTNVKDMEKVSTGFKSMDKLIYGNLFPCFTIWSGYAGCVDADTEYFNGKEWKRIADYVEGDKVLQYTQQGEIELITPRQYHKYLAHQLWHMTADGIDQCLSDEHNIIYVDGWGNLRRELFANIRKNPKQNPEGDTWVFITCNNYNQQNWNFQPIALKDSNNQRVEIQPYKTVDGYKYCFTTDSHMWVMRRNGCIAVTGNSGKSSLANIACLIAPVEQDYKVFVYSGELDNGQLSDWIFSPLAGIRHTLMFENPSGRPSYAVSKEALKCIKDFYRTKFILYDDEDGLDSSGETVLKEMENAYRKYNCRVFLIDNLMTLSFDQLAEDSRWETQKKFIKKLMGFTKKYNVNVNLIVHPKKPAMGTVAEHSVYDLHGASEIGNLCHRLIWIDRLKDDDFGYNTKISIVKDRPSQAAGRECKLYYDYATRRLYSDIEELEKAYNWESHYTITYSPAVESKRLCNISREECDQF